MFCTENKNQEKRYHGQVNWVFTRQTPLMHISRVPGLQGVPSMTLSDSITEKKCPCGLQCNWHGAPMISRNHEINFASVICETNKEGKRRKKRERERKREIKRNNSTLHLNRQPCVIFAFVRHVIIAGTLHCTIAGTIWLTFLCYSIWNNYCGTDDIILMTNNNNKIE